MKHLVFLILMVLLAGVAFSQSRSADPRTLQVISAVAPIYPPIARQANATGDVPVQVEINSEGLVTSVDSEGRFGVLGAASEKAARRWVFSAASDSERRKTTLVFSFRVMPENTQPSEATPIYYPPYRIEVRAIKPVIRQ
jgi:TonB family protein